jgi:hypothetical protein
VKRNSWKEKKNEDEYLERKKIQLCKFTGYYKQAESRE